MTSPSQLRRLALSPLAPVPGSVYCFLRIVALACALGAAGTTALAARERTTGSVNGRVLNSATGAYLIDARVTLTGTTLAAFTDETGTYFLSGVPAGEAHLTVFYTGLLPETTSLTVKAGGSHEQDFALSPAGVVGDDAGITKLGKLVVTADRNVNEKSIAINEQRFAGNIKSVVSTDQFGDIGQDQVGEFLKYMPGVSIEYAPEPTFILLRGINPLYTAVTIDGTNIASAASSGASRGVQIDQTSIIGAERVEVIFSRTPDLSASALGGSVNLVSKSGFELNHPEFTYRAFLQGNGKGLTFNSFSDPGDHATHLIKPGFDFTYRMPVNRKFAFSISGVDSDIYTPQDISYNFWTPVTAGAGATLAKPFLKTYEVGPSPKTTKRQTIALGLDWKPNPADLFSFRANWNFYDSYFSNPFVIWNVQGTKNTAPASWGPDFVDSAPGAASLNQTGAFRHKFGTTVKVDGSYAHRGTVWSYDVAASFSGASNHYHDRQDGHFSTVALARFNLTTNLSGMGSNEVQRPTVLTTTTTTGAPVDWSKLSSYYLTLARFSEADSNDDFKTIKANLQRDYWFLGTTTTVKAGALLQQQIRDIRSPGELYNFVGPGGTAYSATNANAGLSAGSYDLVHTDLSIPAPFDVGAFEWPSPYKAYALMQAHPDYFKYDPSNIATSAMGSKYITETISAGYLMGDTRFFNNRVRLIYGARYERTEDKGQGYLMDPTAKYVRDTNGAIVLGSNGKPVVGMGPNGLPLTDASNALLLNQLQYTDRGLHSSKQYSGLYPSFNASYHFLDNFILRAAYAKAIGRPDFANIIPGSSLPDLTSGAAPSVTVVNSALKPEQADNYDLALEYYFSGVGALSIGVFRKDISNFYGSATVPATAELLAEYNIPEPEAYLQNNGTITSKFNVGTARITGLQLDYKQALTFLPIPGFTVFGNLHSLHLEGPAYADFTSFISKGANLGMAYQHSRYGLQFNMNYRGYERLTSATFTDAVGDKTFAYLYYKARTQFDLTANVQLTKHFALFISGNNITNVPQIREYYGAEMPGYTHQYQYMDLGASWTLGVKAKF